MAGTRTTRWDRRKNWLISPQHNADIYTFHRVAALLSFAAVEVEAWYQCLTQYQHAATMCAAKRRSEWTEPALFEQSTWIDGLFWFPVASVWNALVIDVSGAASPQLETRSETSRLRCVRSSRESHNGRIMHVAEITNLVAPVCLRGCRGLQLHHQLRSVLGS